MRSSILNFVKSVYWLTRYVALVLILLAASGLEGLVLVRELMGGADIWQHGMGFILGILTDFFLAPVLGLRHLCADLLHLCIVAAGATSASTTQAPKDLRR